MNRTLLVTLLRKDIQELDMITEGFMEMNEYPKAIILLAQRKAEDIQQYIKQLSEIKAEQLVDSEGNTAEISVEIASTLQPMTSEPVIETNTKEDIQDEITSAQEFTSELVEIEEESAPEKEEELLIAEPIEFNFTETETEQESETTTEPLKTLIEEKAGTVLTSRNETLSKADNSLGSILANKKISDVKQAISIGDRFRFQRELFNANGEDMNKTLTYINQLATFEEVQSFLESKYKWTEDNEAKEDFYQIVRRRF
jgi:hypothetical protein